MSKENREVEHYDISDVDGETPYSVLVETAKRVHAEDGLSKDVISKLYGVKIEDI